MSNKQIFKVIVQKDGQLYREEQKISIEYEGLGPVVKAFSEELVNQGHTGVIFISVIVFLERDEQKELEMPEFTTEFGERKIK